MPVYILIPLIVIAFVCLAILGRSIAEPHMLNITRLKFGSGKEKEQSARIVFFSDLHAEFCFIPVQKVIDIIKSEKPDIVIFGGDIINAPENKEKGREYLLKIRAACDGLDIPFAGVTGNHDVTLTAGEISSCGFAELDKGSIVITSREGKKIGINGVRDSGRLHRVWYPIPPVEGADFTVTAVHNPDAVLYLPEDNRTDLFLSGHIHAGQIRTPFKIEFTSLRKDVLPKKGIIVGLHKVNGKDVFISAGIGCVALPLRLGAKPEVNIIDLFI